MKRVLLFGLLGLLTIFFVIISIAKNTTSLPGVTSFPTPTPVLAPGQQFQSIDYSQIFKDPAVAKSMGEKFQNPLSTTQEGDYLVGHFASDSATASTDVYKQGRVAKFVVQTTSVDNSYYSDYLLTHDEKNSHTLYDPVYTGSGLVWKIFVSDGVGFFTSPTVGFTGQLLYFAPTTYDNFLNTAAKVFRMSTSQPSDKNGGLENGE